MRGLATTEYKELLREYYEIHDNLWATMGSPTGRSISAKLARLMQELDCLKEDWWKDPKPG